ncbi:MULTISPECIES: DUF4184 family protein [Sphingobacterium]|uniref:DUF4184 family protein n=1 Tax=Sphingobacterium TaxID=28453 RepID=UPI000627F1EA|nr:MULTISPECIES: DUF4184 family protein [Sphingobacterium]KKO89634.1 hypothetical protein AAW12_18590 [Sphingobacterium sp. Ag1]
MPFTFAHPALILPFRKINRRYLSFTGLVVGSMVPDFEFFFKMRTGPNIGHHFPGFFFLDIPLALILCFIFHEFVKGPLYSNVPLFLQKRLKKYASFKWGNYAVENPFVVLFSVTLGIATHVFWDAFTHDDGFFVERFHVLNATIFFLNAKFPVYAILQVIFSLFGLVVVCNCIRKIPKDENQMAEGYIKYWSLIALFTLLFFVMRSLILSHYNTFWDLFMGLMGSLIYAMILVSILGGYKKSDRYRTADKS